MNLSINSSSIIQSSSNLSSPGLPQSVWSSESDLHFQFFVDRLRSFKALFSSTMFSRFSVHTGRHRSTSHLLPNQPVIVTSTASISTPPQVHYVNCWKEYTYNNQVWVEMHMTADRTPQTHYYDVRVPSSSAVRYPSTQHVAAGLRRAVAQMSCCRCCPTEWWPRYGKTWRRRQSIDRSPDYQDTIYLPSTCRITQHWLIIFPPIIFLFPTYNSLTWLISINIPDSFLFYPITFLFLAWVISIYIPDSLFVQPNCFTYVSSFTPVSCFDLLSMMHISHRFAYSFFHRIVDATYDVVDILLYIKTSCLLTRRRQETYRQRSISYLTTSVVISG